MAWTKTYQYVFSDKQVLASIHQTVIPHLSNPAMLWWAYLPELLLFYILFPLIIAYICFPIPDNLQRLPNKIIWYRRSCQCDGSKQPLHPHDGTWFGISQLLWKTLCVTGSFRLCGKAPSKISSGIAGFEWPMNYWFIIRYRSLYIWNAFCSFLTLALGHHCFQHIWQLLSQRN